MALIGNYNVFNKTPGHFTSGPSLSDTRANWGKAGNNRNYYTSTTQFDTFNSIPRGYKLGYCFVLAQKDGGVASDRFMIGSGGVSSANLAGGLNADADLTGTGDVNNAALGLIVSAVADLVGTGVLSGDLIGILEAVADLTGTGTFSTAELTALASMVAPLIGTGEIDATISATGELSADINVTGDLLSTANVAEAIWNAVADGDYTYSEVMKVLVAIQAGKTTIVNNGDGTSTVTFRNLDDTVDRAVFNMDGSERVSRTEDL